jgi:hypothetical protein
MYALAGQHPRHPRRRKFRVTFSVRKTVADMNLEPFEFEDMDGVMQELPNLNGMNTGEAKDLLDLLDSDPMAAIKQLIPTVADMPLGALMPLAKAWMAHCEAQPGESEASSSSKPSTARSSKPTSRTTSTSKTRKR